MEEKATVTYLAALAQGMRRTSRAGDDMRDCAQRGMPFQEAVGWAPEFAGDGLPINWKQSDAEHAGAQQTSETR